MDCSPCSHRNDTALTSDELWSERVLTAVSLDEVLRNA